MTCKFALDRTTDFTGPMQLELMEAPGFAADKVRIEAGGNGPAMRVRVDKSVKFSSDPVLRFRATGKLPSGETVITTAALTVKAE